MKQETKQPETKAQLLIEDGDFYIDIDSDEGGMMLATISPAKTAVAAWRRAAKRLRKLADECEANSLR